MTDRPELDANSIDELVFLLDFYGATDGLANTTELSVDEWHELNATVMAASRE